MSTQLVHNGPGGSMPAKANPELRMALGSALVCIGVGALTGLAGGVVITVICTAVGAAGAIYTVKNLLERNLRPDPPPPTAAVPRELS